MQKVSRIENKQKLEANNRRQNENIAHYSQLAPNYFQFLESITRTLDLLNLNRSKYRSYR